MPTFTTIALDRLLEPESNNSNLKPPPAPVKLEKAVSSSSQKKKIPWPHVSPALYATPEATPLPDSPSSFPPSPYIVNHKRRGPRLLKSISQSDVGECLPLPDVERKAGQVIGDQGDANGFHDRKLELEQKAHSDNGSQTAEVVNGFHHLKSDDGNSGDEPIGPSELTKSVIVDLETDGECEDFFDPRDSMSTTSNTEVDDSNGLERSWKQSTPLGDYFDAFDEISSEDVAQSSCRNFEDEMGELRLNLLMEIEKRKKADESLENLQNQRQRMIHQLSLVGLILPALPTITEQRDGQSNIDPAEELCQQVVVARVVAGSIGRGCSRAEVELEMEPQIESKNFEIARLWDRLHYYEAANREMSQRNQEAVEMARQHRHRRKRRQKWVWSSVGLAITLGAAAIAWSYHPVSSSSSHEGDAAASQEE